MSSHYSGWVVRMRERATIDDKALTMNVYLTDANTFTKIMSIKVIKKCQSLEHTNTQRKKKLILHNYVNLHTMMILSMLLLDAMEKKIERTHNRIDDKQMLINLMKRKWIQKTVFFSLFSRLIGTEWSRKKKRDWQPTATKKGWKESN